MNSLTASWNNPFFLSFLFLLLLAEGCLPTERMGGEAMEPTIKRHERFLIDYSAYSKSSPQRWDIVIFYRDEVMPNGQIDHGKHVNRLVGLPGETITIHDSSVFVNGSKQDYPEKMNGIWYSASVPGSPQKIHFPYTVPDSSYFLLGDNTLEADDSRFEGPVKRTDILGRIEGK
ncbi:MAG: signal peptidase I [Bacteroidota bacterium]|nr:signal peptidase I [Bacteroidota bacterium]MDP4229575.1 signal peptidase I [Bacteroidota bacterium]MDP4237744.1 signal peptidase I [Bacteroidota bacterium]